jgi:2-hydroxychromene-2-carboxylate isomerase
LEKDHFADKDGLAMTLEIDLFWSFRSPYSYLATPRLVALEKQYDLKINARPVYPLAVRFGEFFERAHPLWIPYLMLDTMRIAEMLGLPYRWPRPDPVQVDPTTRKAKPDQPYIHRLTRLGCAAKEEGKGLAFLDQVSRLIWSGTVDNWHEGRHLADAAARAGVDLASLDRKIEADTDKYESIIRQNQNAHEAAGHWGVPTMAFEGEPFFGQDRIELLLWRLKKRGLTERK